MIQEECQRILWRKTIFPKHGMGVKIINDRIHSLTQSAICCFNYYELLHTFLLGSYYLIAGKLLGHFM